jgi:hypothetical protein
MVALKEAFLEVRFATERSNKSREPGTKWTNPTGVWVMATFDCNSRVSAQGVIAKASHRDELEWPLPLQLESDWLRKARKPVN